MIKLLSLQASIAKTAALFLEHGTAASSIIAFYLIVGGVIIGLTGPPRRQQ